MRMHKSEKRKERTEQAHHGKENRKDDDVASVDVPCNERRDNPFASTRRRRPQLIFRYSAKLFFTYF